MKMKILVSVMTYPTLSEKHFETVCTAGFKENGEWVRIYPVPHRLLYRYDKNTYKKWQWIEVDLEKNPKDNRPESFHIKNIDSLVTGDIIEGWDLRKKWSLKNKDIYRNMDELIEKTKRNEISLAVVKPTKIIDVIIEKVDREKYLEKYIKIKNSFEAHRRQLNLFEERQTFDYWFRFADQIPYKFKYVFLTEDGIERRLMIEDWEIGMLYRNCRKDYPPEIACQKVRDKYMKIARDRDVYLFLGTTYQWHVRKSLDPYIIVGVFWPPKQLSFDF